MENTEALFDGISRTFSWNLEIVMMETGGIILLLFIPYSFSPRVIYSFLRSKRFLH